MKSNIGQTITRYEMCEIARKAYLKAMTHNNIIFGLKKGFIHAQMRLLAKKNFFPSRCFRDAESLKQLQAIKSRKEAITAYFW